MQFKLVALVFAATVTATPCGDNCGTELGACKAACMHDQVCISACVRDFDKCMLACTPAPEQQ